MAPNAGAIDLNYGVGMPNFADGVDCGAMVKLENGNLTAKDFRPVKALGNGSMGNVYLVARSSDNAPFAMKVMNKEVLTSKKNEGRAQTEKDILKDLDHIFLPNLHSSFEDEKHQYLVMDYCHGGDLNVLRQKQPEKLFSESACRFYIAEVLLSLEYLHKRNIVYRDLKPENILIQSGGHVMLTDFDLSLDLSKKQPFKPRSHDVASKWQTQTHTRKAEKKKSRGVRALFACASPNVLSKQSSKKGPNRVTPEVATEQKSSKGPANSFVGTEEYVAPEVIWGKGHGLAVDWWTLGVLLYELHYGKTPFKGINRKETFYNILCRPPSYAGQSGDIADLIRNLLAKDPEERLGTKGGAEEIKAHPFFDGVDWNELQNLSRTPVVPEPFSWEVIEKEAEKRRASGKFVQTKWSFFETVEDSAEETVTESEQHAEKRQSQKKSDSSFQIKFAEGFVSQNVEPRDSAATTPRDYSLDEACGDDAVLSDTENTSKLFADVF